MEEPAQQTSVSVQTAPLGAEAQPAPANDFSIPQEYADRGWSSKIKSTDDLFKAYDNAQSLIGKKSAAPAEDAPQEEWDAYYSALRPESPEAYDFGELQGLPEGYDATDLKSTAAKLAHKVGLTPKQARDLVQEYVASEMESAKSINEKLDKEFNELSKEHFGDSLGEAQKTLQEMVSAYVPEALRENILSLTDNPKAALALAKVAMGAKAEIERLKSEYGAEGKITSGGQTASEGIDSVRSELARLRTDKSATDPFHPDFKKNQERIQALSDQVGRYYRGK